jgi:hypothetical protein
VLEAPGARLGLEGTAEVDLRAPAASPGSWRATAEVEAGALGREVPALVTRASGRLTAAVSLDGPPRGGVWRATLDTSPLDFGSRAIPESLTVSALHATFDGRFLRVAPFTILSAAGGHAVVGAEGRPAMIEVLALEPLSLGEVSLTARGWGLTPSVPIEGLRVSDGSFDVRMAGPGGAERRYLFAGTVTIPRAHFERPPKQAPKPPSVQAGLEISHRLWLDLHLVLPDLTVSVPGPDLRLAIDCRVQGPANRLGTIGSVRGLTTYTQFVLAVAGDLRATDVRNCQ